MGFLYAVSVARWYLVNSCSESLSDANTCSCGSGGWLDMTGKLQTTSNSVAVVQRFVWGNDPVVRSPCSGAGPRVCDGR